MKLVNPNIKQFEAIWGWLKSEELITISEAIILHV